MPEDFEEDRPTPTIPPPPAPPSAAGGEAVIRARLAALDAEVGDCLGLINALNQTAEEIAAAANKNEQRKIEISARREAIERERAVLVRYLADLPPPKVEEPKETP